MDAIRESRIAPSRVAIPNRLFCLECRGVLNPMRSFFDPHEPLLRFLCREKESVSRMERSGKPRRRDARRGERLFLRFDLNCRAFVPNAPPRLMASDTDALQKSDL